MSRPKPNIIIEYPNPKTYKSEQVLFAEAVYAVFYKDKPINLRSVDRVFDHIGAKYRKIGFGNSGHAFNLAEKLNKMFKTTDFSVVALTEGKKITESND